MMSPYGIIKISLKQLISKYSLLFLNNSFQPVSAVIPILLESKYIT